MVTVRLWSVVLDHSSRDAALASDSRGKSRRRLVDLFFSNRYKSGLSLKYADGS